MSRLAAVPILNRTLMHFGRKDGLGRLEEWRLVGKGDGRLRCVHYGRSKSCLSARRLSRFEIAVIILHAKSTQLRETLPLMPSVVELLPTLQPGQLVGVYR